MIKPFFEISFLSEEQAKILCEFDIYYFCASKNDYDIWCIQVDWSGNPLTKYPKFDGSSHSSWGKESVSFEFSDLPILINEDGDLTTEPSEDNLERHFGFEVGFYEDDEEKAGWLDIQYLFHQNTKYGVCVYFAPQNWKGFTRKEILLEEQAD